MAQRSFAKHGVIYALALTSLVGCSSINSMLEPNRMDYKSETPQNNTSKLEIPPDLTQLQRDNRYALPDANRGSATASAYNAQQTARPVEQAAAVAPSQLADVRIERSGSQRWLVVNQAPEVLWPRIKDFWQDNGFLINIDSPDTGVMETDWAENRAKIPQDFIRRNLGKIFDSFYSTGERDKFRTRLERGPNGTTEIYLSHRGAEEVLTGQDNERTVWTARPSDPELEAEFLSRLMVQLGVEEKRAKASVANVAPQASRSKLAQGVQGTYVQVDEGFDRAWRRVGLALDRVGFTVEDRDRSQGLYFVRYVDQGDDAQATQKKGFFGNLFSFGSSKDKDKAAARYRISVKGSADSSQVTVLNNEGQVETSKTGQRILSLLNDQLK
ncbi:outer membrane protein assembly factor BamC [uncultured Oxalicibacterium sp.]|uniref:outer membrane protein assembly factor BamC n=1 Tax=uncultured Oxalicibacterium sp. TaxID=1168540 RepID=UPI0025F8987B|nr:outer membrane protein assembly factor BamC [uncultured Oxalicibacterium sp.]